MHQKLQCLQLALVNRKGAILLHDNSNHSLHNQCCKKLGQLGYELLPHLPYSPDHSPTNYTSQASQQLFAKENASCRMQKMLSSSESQAWIFTPQEKTNLFSLAKMC